LLRLPAATRAALDLPVAAVLVLPVVLDVLAPAAHTRRQPLCLDAFQPSQKSDVLARDPPRDPLRGPVARLVRLLAVGLIAQPAHHLRAVQRHVGSKVVDAVDHRLCSRSPSVVCAAERALSESARTYLDLVRRDGARAAAARRRVVLVRAVDRPRVAPTESQVRRRPRNGAGERGDHEGEEGDDGVHGSELSG
jgi:hypothetical protein